MIGATALNTLLWSGTAASRRALRRSVPDPTPPVAQDSETSFQLLLKARAGSPDATERLCARYLPRLQRWAHGRLPRSARTALDTGDVVQEVLMHAIRHLSTFEPENEWSFQAYLRTALIHRLQDEGRRTPKRSLVGPLDDSHPSRDPSPLEHMIGIEALERYEAALARLSDTDKQAIIARYEWGMSHKELAEMLGKSSAGAAQVAVHRALVRLAQEMANDPRS
jgi:RNA polymerase sigma-70 factor (ECF subfamily)